MTTNQKDILKKIIQSIIVILLLITIWYIGKDWLRPRIIKALGGYTAMEQKETIDTLSVKYDSIYFNQDSLKSQIYLLTKGKLEKDKTIRYYKELITSNKHRPNDIIVHNDSKDFIAIDSTFAEVKDFDLDITDSLIAGNIKTTINVKDANIIAQSLNYKPKLPILVTKTVTVEKVIEKTLSNKSKGYFGIGGVASSDNKIGGLVLYQTSSKWQFQGGYIKEVTSSNKSKDIIQIGIIKLF